MYHEITEFQNMMINIIEYGYKEIWKEIEKEKNPFERCKKRKLYKTVIDKIDKETKTNIYE